MPLERWMWRSYLRAAIIPLLVIELSFLAIYWASSVIVYHQNVYAMTAVARRQMAYVAHQEGHIIATDLDGFAHATAFFKQQTLAALDTDHVPSAAVKERFGPGPKGSYQSLYDNGTTASFYANITPVGQREIQKVWNLSRLDPIMPGIAKSDPRIAGIYLNTPYGYSLVYPYIDASRQIPPDTDVTKYNFFYEADAAHNPTRKQVWTDAYLDPAGQSWIVSVIDPVWREGKLEGVVGIDVSLKTIVRELRNLRLPWNGFAMLVSREGAIIAMPPKAESYLNLRELTDYSYTHAVTGDTFKPAEYNIYRREDMRGLAAAMKRAPSGLAELKLAQGPHLASFSTIAGPDWKLVVIAPEAEIFADAEATRTRLYTIGSLMALALLGFYAIFFVILLRRAQAMSTFVAAPVEEVSRMLEGIGKGRYEQTFGGSAIAEINDLGNHLVQTGEALGAANRTIMEQESVVSEALDRQQRLNARLLSFVRLVSHEVRTPLAIIDSSIQVISRKAEAMTPEGLRERAGRMRNAVKRMSNMLSNLVDGMTTLNEFHEGGAREREDVVDLVGNACRDSEAGPRLKLDLPPRGAIHEDALVLRAIVVRMLRAAALASSSDSTIDVGVTIGEAEASIAVSFEGPSLANADFSSLEQKNFDREAFLKVPEDQVNLFTAGGIAHDMGGEFSVSVQGSRVTATARMPVTMAETHE